MKIAIKREQNDACIGYAEREQFRTKFKKNILSLAALLIASATFVACSSDSDNIIEEPQPANGKYTMTIKASKGDDAATRALSLSGSTLNATWAENEEVKVYEGANLLGTLTPDISTLTNNDTQCTLKGTLTTSPSASGVTLTLKFNTASISGQNGTLSYVASHNDYAIATTTVTVSGNNVTGTAAEFSNQNAVARFSLMDGSTVLTPSKVTVSVTTTDQTILGGLTSLGKSLPTYTFTIADNYVTANGGNYLYIAMPTISGIAAEMGLDGDLVTAMGSAASTGDIKLNITATVGSDTYTYTKSGYPFVAGKFYDITVKMKVDYSNAALGDLFYSDGTYSSTLQDGKTPIGVIAYLGTDNFTENGTNVGTDQNPVTFSGHGLVLCLKNAASKVAWSTNTTTQAYTGNGYVTDTESLMRSNGVSGYLATKAMATSENSSTVYPAAHQAKNYTELTAPASTTGWFLPSAQQWVKMLQGLGSINNTFDIKWAETFDSNNYGVTAWNGALEKSGEGNYDIMKSGTEQYTFYSSSESTVYNVVTLTVHWTNQRPDLSNGLKFSGTNKNNSYIDMRVRPVLAF